MIFTSDASRTAAAATPRPPRSLPPGRTARSGPSLCGSTPSAHPRTAPKRRRTSGTAGPRWSASAFSSGR